MFYLNSTLNFGIPPVLVFQLEVYYKVGRLLTDLTAQQKGITARWYSNKTSLLLKVLCMFLSAHFVGWRSKVNKIFKLCHKIIMRWDFLNRVMEVIHNVGSFTFLG